MASIDVVGRCKVSQPYRNGRPMVHVYSAGTGILPTSGTVYSGWSTVEGTNTPPYGSGTLNEVYEDRLDKINYYTHSGVF